MKISEFDNKSVSDLIKKKNELVSRIFEMKMKNSIGQLETPHLIKSTRRDIARINTVLVRKTAR